MIKRKNLRKGIGIRVKITGDINEYGEQKIRPGIVIKSYPSHVKTQLLTTEINEKEDYYYVTTNKIGYVRPIYHVTISYNQIKSLWFERGKVVQIEHDSTFFRKIIEMEYKEIFEQNLNLENIENLQCENEKLKLEIIKKNEQMQELINWNKNLQDENLKFITELELYKLRKKFR